jgi:hypothetical protein
LGTITGTSGTIGPLNFAVTPAQVADMRAKRHYVNIHSSNFPGGEIRGQVKPTETVMDQDGDGRTDLTVFRQSTNSFYTLFSTNRSLFINQFTTENFYTHLNHTADFDGDGRADPLLLERGAGNVVTWSILQTGTNTVRRVQWGNQTSTNRERFALADYDGDGKMDIAVYRQSQATWYILESSTGNGRFERFGAITDNPAVGDYDKDGKADLTVTRVENGQHAWYTRLSSTGQDMRVLWGNSQTDTTNFFTSVDFDGDGAQDRMVTRPVDGQIQFNILLSSNGSQLYLTFGLTEDVRLFGDYDGDGKTDIVARRVINGQMAWFILLSSSGYNVTQHRTEPWGITDDQLVEEPEMLLDRFEPKTD